MAPAVNTKLKSRKQRRNRISTWALNTNNKDKSQEFLDSMKNSQKRSHDTQKQHAMATQYDQEHVFPKWQQTNHHTESHTRKAAGGSNSACYKRPVNREQKPMKGARMA